MVSTIRRPIEVIDDSVYFDTIVLETIKVVGKDHDKYMNAVISSAYISNPKNSCDTSV